MTSRAGWSRDMTLQRNSPGSSTQSQDLPRNRPWASVMGTPQHPKHFYR
jgi:hypothetical protein